GAAPDAPAATATPAAIAPSPATPSATATLARAQTPVAGGQTAVITAADPNAEVNVRSRPSVDSDPLGYGRVGDSVVLGRSETAADGQTWHYVTFADADTVGWVRSDFLDLPALSSEAEAAAAPAVAVQSDSLKAALDEQCGSVRAIEAYYVTQSHTIYVCQRRGQRLYLSQEQGTDQVISATEVEALGGGYLIGNGNFEYRLDSSSVVVVRFDDSGRQDEVLREAVIYAERP
ncbi:MAG TPA: SH3 domain-containing protein, partial [Candidatus Obscuribacterales bacterium]